MEKNPEKFWWYNNKNVLCPRWIEFAVLLYWWLCDIKQQRSNMFKESVYTHYTHTVHSVHRERKQKSQCEKRVWLKWNTWVDGFYLIADVVYLLRRSWCSVAKLCVLATCIFQWCVFFYMNLIFSEVLNENCHQRSHQVTWCWICEFDTRVLVCVSLCVYILVYLLNFVHIGFVYTEI